MDFFSMKRKKLQSLCKKHGIPANLKNKEMAEKLSFIYKGKEDTDDGTEKGGTFDSVNDKDKLNVEIIDLDSDTDDTNKNVQMTASDIPAGKESDAHEKMIAEHFLEVKSSDLEIDETIASGTDAGNADANEKGIDKENVDNDNHEQHPTTPSSDARVVTEESGNYLVEREVEKLSEKTSVIEETSETGKVGDEAETQDHNNSHSVTRLVEEANILYENENICAHGAINKDSNISEASTMCIDTSSIGAKDTDEKTNVTVEDILDEANSSSFEDSDGTPVQFHQTDTSDLHAHKMVAPGIDTKSADTSEAQKISMSLASEKMIESSPKLINNSEIPIDDIGLCDVEIGVNKEQADICQEVLNEEPSVVVMKDDENLKQVASPNLQGADMEIFDMEENMQLGVNKEQVDHTQKVFHTKPSVEIMNDDLVQVVSEDMQVGVNKDQVDHSHEVLHEEPSMVVMKDDDDLQQVTLQDLQVADMELCDMEENMQLGNCKEQVDHSQEVLHLSPSVVVMKEYEKLQQVTSQDLQVADIELCDMEENIQIRVNEDQVGVDGDQVDHSQEVLHAEPSRVVMKDKDDLVQVGLADIQFDFMGFSDVEENMEIGVNKEQVNYCRNQEVFHAEPSVVVMKDDDDCVQIASEDIQVDMGFSAMKENMQIGFNAEPSSVVVTKDDEDCVQVASEHIPADNIELSYEKETMCIGIMHQMNDLDADTCEEMLKSSQKTGQIADQEDCIGYFPNNNLEASVSKDFQASIGYFSNNNLEASVSKDFQAETYFDPSTLGDVEVTMNEIMQSGKMEKENNQEECSFNRLFDNSDFHDGTSGMGAEDENQSYMMSHKRKRCDENQSNGLDSAEKEKADGFVSTMTQLGEMESCDFNIHQIFASGTAKGDEGTCYQEKLESPAKGTPIESSKKNINFSPKFHGSSMMNKGLENESILPLISASDMKENIKIDKNDQVRSIMSKGKFANRQPLQDLQQN